MGTFSPQQNNIQLPKLCIEPFNEDPQHFLSFWYSFRYSVHENEPISNVQKMTYLKDFLKGDALN